MIYPWMGLSLLGLVNIASFTAVCFLALVAHGKGSTSVHLFSSAIPCIYT